MIERHKAIISSQLIRASNYLTQELDNHVFILSGFLPGTAEQITDDADTLKQIVAKNMTVYNAKRSQAGVLLSRVADEAFIGSKVSRQTMSDNITAIGVDFDVVTSNLSLAVSKDDLADIPPLFESDVPIITEAKPDYVIRKVNSANDLLDCCYYVLSSINPSTGERLDIDAKQTRQLVGGFAATFYNNQGICGSHPDYISMKHVMDEVLGQLDTTEFSDIARYIEQNVEKLPLLRRPWA